ncbi:3-deoxy-7-phosphoheptulonate synthase [Methylophilus medardicus]|uniref:Phospho-2-dehydro-3-deoxyheptonate aldolase n=1 Tax=Methylophilus medardicus TaxID=2588534 RepID=A0A5B8CSN3_9PROT|nr:3-deoxy-7-phosphoheptulonate synthase [Methylophilus medardicus]QDC44229.1 3-deoxy-7-phosphoheptulonate synthase [Methylophilus medardicus]QDC49236.1 3-deoxy-7-phosphoheptulonate synthase [Methylophilus medardicus]QDC52941.1 3-deoxy-7-phosphoheptulonate synthase [Methylophilus medardicus]
MTVYEKLATDDVRVLEIKPLIKPAELLSRLQESQTSTQNILKTRSAIHHVLHQGDDRLLVIVGPCSIHDTEAGMEYAQRLLAVRNRLAGELLIVMRVYFEKPRTTVGWKGLINDPHLDGTYDINLGLEKARRFLLDVNEIGMPAATEFLDVVSPQYTADLVSWGAIGARTTESQIHRELASGLSCPVGFKNGTDGGVKVAIDAIKTAASPHHFLSMTKEGESAIFATKGNEDCHVILRGGKLPNYDTQSVAAVCDQLAEAGLAPVLMVDCSHGNSQKQYKNQIAVVDDVAAQVAAGDARIIGLMLESHLNEGRQDHSPGCNLNYGQSITDACLGWEDSVAVLETLAASVKARREKRAAEE